MSDLTYRIRTATPAEIAETAVNWAADEGWNPGASDADCYYAADPRGFRVGLLGSEPVATISVVRYSDSVGFLGFYIVKPEYRGRGYGLAIWHEGLHYLDGCSVGLDGVIARQDDYGKSGFQTAFRNRRYEGAGTGSIPARPDIVALSSLTDERVLAYDRPFFPADRSRFVRTWVHQPGCVALGAVRDGTLAGYGVLRRCRSGRKIGPLFADSDEVADLLFVSLAAHVRPVEPIYLDVPDANPAAVGLAERHGMRVVFETARMYRGSVPELPLGRIFGVTSFEIG